jgi:hypothetical protein
MKLSWIIGQMMVDPKIIMLFLISPNDRLFLLVVLEKPTKA